MKRLFVVLASASLVLAGCGGVGGTGTPGEISGVVSDVNAGTVRNARVYVGSTETFSNSSGIYVLSNISPGERTVRAEVSQDGIDYFGQNVTTVFDGERSKNVNIAVVRTDQLARIHGTVRDDFGNRIGGARVFAFGNAFTSSVAITDSSGNYEMRGLSAGIVYTLTASARTFNSDVDTVLLVPGEDEDVDFVLTEETDPFLPAPQNLSAIAWTSPFEPTRAAQNPQLVDGIEAVKQMLDPRRGLARTRTTALGNHVEVDLYWNALPSQYYTALLGFGVYRANSAVGAAFAIDFLRDPNALFFADIDDGLIEDQTYYYEITALNTSYPGTANSESNPSNRYGVLTLGDLELLATTVGPTFNWIPASGAEEYVVYLFDEYPRIGESPIWSNESSPTTGNSLMYSGPALTSGQRYYFVVLGTANGGDSRTLSLIADFLAN